MPEPRKAETPPADSLDLAAFAWVQMRAKAVDGDEGLAKRCAGCPGPDAKGGCGTRGPGRWEGRTLPFCARGMLRSRFWHGIVDIRSASLIAPLSDWPDGYAKAVVDGCIELRVADAEREEEKARARAAAPPGPVFAGRTSAREG